jgi:hypothetical protein
MIGTDTQYWTIGNVTYIRNTSTLVYTLHITSFSHGDVSTGAQPGTTGDAAMDDAVAQPGGSSPGTKGAGSIIHGGDGGGDDQGGEDPERPLDPYHARGHYVDTSVIPDWVNMRDTALQLIARAKAAQTSQARAIVAHDLYSFLVPFDNTPVLRALSSLFKTDAWACGPAIYDVLSRFFANPGVR